MMLVTNGFFLHRFPELPKVFVDTECQLEISQHGTHQDYLERFREVKAIVWSWRTVSQASHQHSQGRTRAGCGNTTSSMASRCPSIPSQTPHIASVCSEHCTQLVNGCLAKCPALAYWPQLETKARLESISEWDLFRDYEACPPTASDDELRSFLETKSIPQWRVVSL